ncbi:MAG: HEPN domain-containing protein [bacterium]
MKDKKFKSKSKEAYLAWYEQGLRDLEVAEFCYNNSYYEWACFCYQEATVKILKALLKKNNLESFRHSAYSLLEELSKKLPIDKELFDLSGELDKHYIMSRYPGANMLQPPFKVYKKEIADTAKNIANKIIQFAKNYL